MNGKLRAPGPTRDGRRADLIAAARQLFAAKGYHDTTVDDITRAAGVAKGTFYLYFDEKRAIYLDVIRGFMQLIKDIGATVGEDIPDSSPLTFFTRAERAAMELMNIFVEHRELARLAYRESIGGGDPILVDMIGTFYREIAEVEARNIRLAMELGLVRKVDPLLTAYAHIGMVERVLLALVDNPGAFPEPTRLIHQMMRLAFEGLRAPGAPSPFPVPAI